jgi:Domain of unknown function (DUF222)
VSWWYFDEGRRFGLEADLPASQGAIVVRALGRMAQTIPAMPDEAGGGFASARRADALVALCSARIAPDPDPDRATVVIHAPIDALVRDAGSCEIEDGPAVHPEAVRRLLCDARSRPCWRIVRATRSVSAACRGSLRHRCFARSATATGDADFRDVGRGRSRRRTTSCWWRHGGRTDLDNLVLICSFHHRLVHELGWSVRRDADGSLRWFRRDGHRHRAGPSPGIEAEKQVHLAAAG